MADSRCFDASVPHGDGTSPGVHEGQEAPIRLEAEGAFAHLVRLVNVRDRSELELRQRLASKGHAPDVVEAAVSRARRCGLVDDERFARAYVGGKLRKGWGRERIERALEGFGVSPRVLGSHPDDVFAEADELERALEELGRFKSAAQNLHEARYRRLAAKGFSAQVIQGAVAQFEREASNQDAL
ncbi:MAG: recombination regulator RecX [Coriobacteriales bacterium]|nr:recombination regulator RecX [Coriobacteriales bacterium]